MAPSIADLPWPVRTDRLAIRPAVAGDAPAVFRFRSQDAVSEWIGSRQSDLAAYSAKYDDPAWLAKMLVVELDGEVIGDLYVGLQDAWSQQEVADSAAESLVEVGWTLDPAYVGQGFATEAAQALLGICFDGLGVRRVVALCFADNTGSWRLMERLGMRREAHRVQESLHRDRGWLDSFDYAMLADEWRLSRGPGR